MAMLLVSYGILPQSTLGCSLAVPLVAMWSVVQVSVDWKSKVPRITILRAPSKSLMGACDAFIAAVGLQAFNWSSITVTTESADVADSVHLEPASPRHNPPPWLGMTGPPSAQPPLAVSKGMLRSPSAAVPASFGMPILRQYAPCF